MIELKALSLRYATGPAVLQRVDLAVARGGFAYVLGGSGAGKTSLLAAVAGELRPYGGSVRVFGKNPWAEGEAGRRLIRQSISWITQEPRLIPELTVRENIELGARWSNRVAEGGGDRVGVLMEALQLGHRARSRASELSGGEAQRVSIARALARAPELILADEPTGSQDSTMAWRVMDLLARAGRAGATVLMATHDQEIVRRLGRDCYSLEGGKLKLSSFRGSSAWA